MIFVITKDLDKIITIVEGAGDNLTAEDEADGYIDYVMTNIYSLDEDGEITLEDSGQMLSRTFIENLSEDELVRRVLDYWSQDEEYWVKGVIG